MSSIKAISNIKNRYDKTVNAISSFNDKLNRPDEIIKSAFKFKDSKEPKKIEDNNIDETPKKVSNKLNEIEESVSQNISEIDPHNSRKLSEISENLKLISEQIKEFKNALIDNQDTEIKRTSKEPYNETTIQANNDKPSQGFLDNILSWLGGLLGLGNGTILGALKSLGSFLSSPIEFVKNILKGGIGWVWDQIKDKVGKLASTIVDPLKAGLGNLKDKWNNFTDWTSKKLGIENKFKTDTDLKDPKKGIFESTTDKIKNKVSKAYNSVKETAKNGLEWVSKKASDLKGKLGKIVESGYNSLKASAKQAWEFACSKFSIIAGKLDNALSVVGESMKRFKESVKNSLMEPIKKAIMKVFDKFAPTGMKKAIPLLLNNWSKIAPRLVALGAKASTKMVPIAGFAVGAYMAWDLFKRGKWILGTLSAISAIISLFPGIGGIIAVCLDLGIGAADIISDTNDASKLDQEAEYLKKRIEDEKLNVEKGNDNTGLKESDFQESETQDSFQLTGKQSSEVSREVQQESSPNPVSDELKDTRRSKYYENMMELQRINALPPEERAKEIQKRKEKFNTSVPDIPKTQITKTSQDISNETLSNEKTSNEKINNVVEPSSPVSAPPIVSPVSSSPIVRPVSTPPVISPVSTSSVSIPSKEQINKDINDAANHFLNEEDSSETTKFVFQIGREPTKKETPGLEESHKKNISQLANVQSTAVFTSMNETFMDKLKAALVNFKEATGRTVTITSAKRTDEKQAELWVRGNIYHEPGIYMPARPVRDTTINYKGQTHNVKGSGKKPTAHMSGNAVDIATRDASAFAPFATAQGLTWFGEKDPPHFQLTGGKASPEYDGVDLGNNKSGSTGQKLVKSTVETISKVSDTVGNAFDKVVKKGGEIVGAPQTSFSERLENQAKSAGLNPLLFKGTKNLNINNNSQNITNQNYSTVIQQQTEKIEKEINPIEMNKDSEKQDKQNYQNYDVLKVESSNPKQIKLAQNNANIEMRHSNNIKQKETPPNNISNINNINASAPKKEEFTNQDLIDAFYLR